MTLTRTEAFTAFARDAGEQVRRALIAMYGPELGAEATAEALAYGWEHWAKVAEMDNPAGYLYKVGHNKARRILARKRPPLPAVEASTGEAWVEPGLPQSLEGLTGKQRAAVVLIHGYGLSYQDVSELLGGSRSTVQQHLERGMRHLREDLGVDVVS